MSLLNLFPSLLQYPCFVEQPLVFIDVGASGALKKEWKVFAPYSICIAFEPDSRDFQLKQDNSSLWMKLHCINRIVSDSANDKPFYFTASPHCSSTLPPNADTLDSWNFSNLFSVEKVAQLPVTTISSVLAALNLDYLDWFKTDSQGTDLKIWTSIEKEIRNSASAVEFEPGIINAYHGEDKLHTIMAFMDEPGWWMSAMKVRGDKRISRETCIRTGLNDLASIPISPGWAEVTYLRDLTADNRACSMRDYLAAWMISVTLGQLGNALEVANTAKNSGFASPFSRIYELTLNSIKATNRQVSFRRSIMNLLSQPIRAVFPRGVH